MQLITRSLVFRQLFFIGVIFVLWQLLEMLGIISLATMAFIPLFGLQCGSAGGSGGSGGSGGAGGGGGGYGGSGAATGNTGSTGGSTGSVGPSNEWSTPFLYTWNGERFQLDNDFLLGEPTTFFNDIEVGRKAYEKGEVGPDLYRIRNSFSLKDGRLAFQIREIEAEESFIDHLSLTHVVYPKASELVVDSRHKKFFVFSHESLKRREGIVRQDVLVNGDKAPSFLGDVAGLVNSSAKQAEGQLLEAGDTIEIRGKVENAKEPLFLLLGSRYRDWTAGKIVRLEEAKRAYKNISLFSPRGALQLTTLVLLAGVVWVSGFADRFNRISNTANTASDNRILADAFGIPSARADFPGGGGTGNNEHSLLLESWDWDKKSFQLAEIVHPRHSQYSADAISLPKKATSKTGDVRVRITATKRHYVNVISLFAPQKQMGFKTEKLSARNVYHNRLRKEYSGITKVKNSKEYLHTIPGDVVDVEFDTPSNKKVQPDEQEAHLLHATGFYTSLSEDSRREAGDWTKRLEPEERSLLAELYPLEDYHKSDRATVL